jgi:hypothetical protein
MPRTRRATPEAAPVRRDTDGGDVNAAKRSDKETVVTLRLPRDLHDRLKEAGGERGLSAQIRDRLEASLAMEEAWQDPLFGDLMRAVGHVIVAATRLYPSDPDAYSIVQLAIRMLLNAFRPDRVPDITHDIYDLYLPATIQMLAKVDRLLGVALGALGERGIAKVGKLPFLTIAEEAEKREDEEE